MPPANTFQAGHAAITVNINEFIKIPRDANAKLLSFDFLLFLRPHPGKLARLFTFGAKI